MLCLSNIYVILSHLLLFSICRKHATAANCSEQQQDKVTNISKSLSRYTLLQHQHTALENRQSMQPWLGSHRMDICSTDTPPLALILPSTEDTMLPHALSALANMTFTLLATLTIWRCTAYNMLFPPREGLQPNWRGHSSSSKSEQLKDDSCDSTCGRRRTAQIRAMRAPLQAALCMHSMLYVVELGCTNMLCGYSAMAVHHALSLLLFAVTLYEPYYVCTIWVIPYWLHSVYWVVLTTVHSAVAESLLLTAYNISLFLAAAVFHYLLRLRAVNSMGAPFILFGIATLNYYIYCSPVYAGAVCLYRFDPYLMYLEGNAQTLETAAGALMVMLPLVWGTCCLVDRQVVSSCDIT